jgi:hypothetical protein
MLMPPKEEAFAECGRFKKLYTAFDSFPPILPMVVCAMTIGPQKNKAKIKIPSFCIFLIVIIIIQS